MAKFLIINKVNRLDDIKKIQKSRDLNFIHMMNPMISLFLLKMKSNIVVQIPCLNEESTIEMLLKSLKTLMLKL